MESKLKTVPQRLSDLGKLYSERNAVYGDDYKIHGNLMLSIFPHGIELNTAEDFNRFASFIAIVVKLNRYASNWDEGHPDSLDDISVYAQMLQELDADMRRAKEEKNK